MIRIEILITTSPVGEVVVASDIAEELNPTDREKSMCAYLGGGYHKILQEFMATAGNGSWMMEGDGAEKMIAQMMKKKSPGG